MLFTGDRPQVEDSEDAVFAGYSVNKPRASKIGLVSFRTTDDGEERATATDWRDWRLEDHERDKHKYSISDSYSSVTHITTRKGGKSGLLFSNVP